MIGVLGFDSRRGLGIFLFTTVSRTALGPTQPPIQWVPRALSLRVKRSGREADPSPPSSAEVENERSYTPLPNTSSWRGAELSIGTTLPLPFIPPLPDAPSRRGVLLQSTGSNLRYLTGITGNKTGQAKPQTQNSPR
jgi:hypothetical protein